jgi:hypothetical protein
VPMSTKAVKPASQIRPWRNEGNVIEISSR